MVKTISVILLLLFASAVPQRSGEETKSSPEGNGRAALPILPLILQLGKEEPGQPDWVGRWEFDAFFELNEIPEPSGIIYHPSRRTLFVVSDEGYVAEISRDAQVIQLKQIKDILTAAKRKFSEGHKFDMEGIAVNPSTSLLYAIDESDANVYELEPEGLELLRVFRLKYYWKDTIPPGFRASGYEGIAFIPDSSQKPGGYFIVAKQAKPSTLLKFILPLDEKGEHQGEIEAEKQWEYWQVNIGDLYWNDEENLLWVSHAYFNVLTKFDLEKGEIVVHRSLPGASQEGITLDDEGRLWVAQDLGGVARYEPVEKEVRLDEGNSADR